MDPITRPHRAAGAVLAATALTLGMAACAGSPPPGEDGVIHVPAEAETIQEAVDLAQTGDVVLVAPGEYDESVAISTAGIVLRGEDRAGVVLDGGGVKANGIVVTVDDVRVENLTVHDYTLNGVLVTGMADENGGLARGSDGYRRLDPAEFPPLDGFAVRYVTATNNGLYGIYAFDSHNGLIAENYASGSSDSGIYVGQCEDCGVVVRDNVGEHNAVGYEQANASDSVAIFGNRWSGNRIGMTLISDYQEAFVPLDGAFVAGNAIVDNGVPETPAHAEGGFGIGIGTQGAQDILLTRNLIAGNPVAGVSIGSTEDLAPIGNRIIDNRFADNAVDVAYSASERAPGAGNCLAGEAGPTLPRGLAASWSCPDGNAESAGTPLEFDAPDGISYRDVAAPAPGSQPEAPDDVFDLDREAAMSFDPDEIVLPDRNLLLERTRDGGDDARG